MFVFRYTGVPDLPDAGIEDLMDTFGVHSDQADIASAPGTVNAMTMFQYLFQKTVGYQLPRSVGYAVDSPSDAGDSQDSGAELTPPIDLKPRVETLPAVLRADANWSLLKVNESDLKTGDVIIAERNDISRTHQLAIANLSMGQPMLLLTAVNLDGPSLMAVRAFLADHVQPDMYGVRPPVRQ